MNYQIEYANGVHDAIETQAFYIANESGFWNRAIDWIDGLYEIISQLVTMPEKYAIAPESVMCIHEYRQIVYGDYLITYRIIKETKTIRIVSFCHGGQLPKALE